jgi:hypothetical protein
MWRSGHKQDERGVWTLPAVVCVVISGNGIYLLKTTMQFHLQGLQSSHLGIESTGAEHARRSEPDTIRRMMYVKERTTSDCRVLDWGGELVNL